MDFQMIGAERFMVKASIFGPLQVGVVKLVKTIQKDIISQGVSKNRESAPNEVPIMK